MSQPHAWSFKFTTCHYWAPHFQLLHPVAQCSLRPRGWKPSSWATGSSHTSSSRTCWCASSPLRQRRDETGHPTSVHPRRSGAGGPARAERHEGEQKNASRVKWGVPHVRCLVVWILGVDSFLSHVIACSDPCWRKTSCT